MDKNGLIFVVEDNKTYAHLLKEFLSSKGYQNIELFHNKKEVLENIYKCPSCVLLDYNLIEADSNENQSGREVLIEIMAFDPNIPVIFISAQTSIEEAVETLKLGAYDYLEKNNDLLKNLEHQLSTIGSNKKRVEIEAKKSKNNKIALIVGVAAITALITYFIIK